MSTHAPLIDNSLDSKREALDTTLAAAKAKTDGCEQPLGDDTIDRHTSSAYHTASSTPRVDKPAAALPKGGRMSAKDSDITSTNTEQWSDDLLRVAKHQDRAAYARLFNYYAPRVKSYLLSLKSDTSTSAAADELTQETMIKLWVKAGSFNPDKAAVSTWIFAIARNCRIDFLRKASRHNTPISADDLWPVSEEPEPYVFLEQDKASKTVSEAMSQLPNEQKDIIHRVYLQGKSHSEIASDTGLPLGTVKSRARLGLNRLRKILV